MDLKYIVEAYISVGRSMGGEDLDVSRVYTAVRDDIDGVKYGIYPKPGPPYTAEVAVDDADWKWCVFSLWGRAPSPHLISLL